MTETTIYLLGAVAGYLIGGFPTGVVLSKVRYRIDVREMGSGNIGATNVTRVFGWYAGVFTLVIDFLKGFLPALAVMCYPGAPVWLITVVGIFSVLGHCFSPFLKFKGGKGVATGFGYLAVVAPWLAGIGAVAYVVMLSLTKISAVGSLCGLLVALVYLFVEKPDLPITVLVVALVVIILACHRSNISRLLGKGDASPVGADGKKVE